MRRNMNTQMLPVNTAVTSVEHIGQSKRIPCRCRKTRIIEENYKIAVLLREIEKTQRIIAVGKELKGADPVVFAFSLQENRRTCFLILINPDQFRVKGCRCARP